MIFANRIQAGEILAKKISKLKIDRGKSIICAIPRGGVLVAFAIFQKLHIPMTTLVIKKIGAPQNSELAIGATASFGKPVFDQWLAEELGVSKDYFKKEVIKKRKEARSREKFLEEEFWGNKFKKKTVIVVDDGLATGQTAKAVARIIRTFAPKELILAVGCASPSAIDLIGKNYDRIICPQVSDEFWAVGQFYRDFSPVSEMQVKEILASVRKKLTNNS